MIEVTQIRAQQLEPWLEIRNAIRTHDPLTVIDVVDWERQADDTAWLLAHIDGCAVGAGLGVVGWQAEAGVVRLEPLVLPGHRREGVGTALLEALTDWARANGQTHGEAPVAELDLESQAWAERRGCAEVGRQSLMMLDLSGFEPPAIDPPEGIEIVSWAERPDAIRSMYDVACEAYVDIPGEESTVMQPFEDWVANDMQGSGDSPAATFVALADGVVVGYAKLVLSTGATGVAFHDLTGVRRTWRGQGIAGALKRAELRWAKDAGLTRLQTQNEVRNVPIRILNQRYGFVVEPGFVTMRGTLPLIKPG